MFAVKPSVYFPTDKHYQRRRKYYKKYDRSQAHSNRGPNYDLRLIILRHGERVDTTLGNHWYDQVFGGVPSASSRMYQNPVLPRDLPHRVNTLLYVFDPPITRAGQQKSYSKGRALASQGLAVDACYSSPASRSVLTASAVLQGMNRSQVPLRIEPYLFEPMTWNTPLQELGDVSPFMSTREWSQSGFNVDRQYRRINDFLNPNEKETDFRQRSQIFLQSIERRHGAARGRHSTVMFVGHAASPLIFANIAQQQPFDVDAFGQNCGNIPFLYSIVLERNAIDHTWSMRNNASFV